MASTWILLMTIGLQLFTGSLCTAYDDLVFCGAEFELKHIFLLVPSRDELPQLTRYLSFVRSAMMVRNTDDEGLVHVISDPEDREAIYRHTIESNVYVSHTPYCVPKTELSTMQERRANRTLLEKLREGTGLGNLIDREPVTYDERTVTKEQNGAIVRLLKNGRLPTFSRRFIRAADATSVENQAKAVDANAGHVTTEETNGMAARVARRHAMASTERPRRSRLVKRQDDDNDNVSIPPRMMTENTATTEITEATPPSLDSRRSHTRQGKGQSGRRESGNKSEAGTKTHKSHVHGNLKRTTDLPETPNARGKGSNRKVQNREEGKGKGGGHRSGSKGKQAATSPDEDDASRLDDTTDANLMSDIDDWLAHCIVEAPDTELAERLQKMLKHVRNMQLQKARG